MKEMWEDRYKNDEFFYGTQPNDFLKAQVSHLPKGGRILCVAEGEGRNAVFLVQEGFQVTGVDYSEAGRSKALKLAQIRNITIQYDVADLANYNFGVEKWDGVVSIFNHLPEPLRAHVLQSVKRALKPDGVFLIEGYNPKQLQYKTGGPSTVEMLYTQDILRQHFGANWLLLEDAERDIQEGTGHSGQSSVVHGVWRKVRT